MLSGKHIVLKSLSAKLLCAHEENKHRETLVTFYNLRRFRPWDTSENIVNGVQNITNCKRKQPLRKVNPETLFGSYEK